MLKCFIAGTAFYLTAWPALGLNMTRPNICRLPRPNCSAAQIGQFTVGNGLKWTANGMPRVVFGLTTNSSGDPFTSPDALIVGGTEEMASAPLTVRAHPYGPLDLAVVFSAVMSDRPLYGTRAGIAPNGYAVAANYSALDAVTMYEQAGNSPARITASSAVVGTDGVAHTVTYDAAKAYFSPPLPAADVALLRPNMHVMTNSVGPTSAVRKALGKPDPNGKVIHNTYVGQILPGGPGVGWAANGSWIAIDRWVVIGGGNAAAGQVPSTTYDTVRSNYAAAAAFIGVYSKAFVRNAVCSMPPNGDPPGDANNPKGMVGAQTLECEVEEADAFDYGTVDYQNTFHGYTYQYSSLGGAKPSTDSYGFHSGGLLPHHFVADEDPYADTFLSNAAVITGNAGPRAAEPVGTRSVLTEFDKFANGATNFRLTSYLQKDTSNTSAGQGTHSLVLGLITNGTKGNASTGDRQGRIVFDGQGNSGGLQLCGFSACGPQIRANGSLANVVVGMGGVDVTGSSTFRGDVNFSGKIGALGGIYLANTTVAALPTCSTAAKGMMYYATDVANSTINYRMTGLTGGGNTGVPVSCNGSSWEAH